jgi:N utilization substance protein B
MSQEKNVMSRQRSKARRLAVQALYQWQIAGQELDSIITQFSAENAEKTTDFAYFSDLLRGVVMQQKALDERLRPQLDRAILSIDPVERAILRLATYELIERPSIPYKVIINEAVELAKTFGAEQGHRYVNGVIDKTAKIVRPLESTARKAKSKEKSRATKIMLPT